MQQALSTYYFSGAPAPAFGAPPAGRGPQRLASGKPSGALPTLLRNVRDRFRAPRRRIVKRFGRRSALALAAPQGVAVATPMRGRRAVRSNAARSAAVCHGPGGVSSVPRSLLAGSKPCRAPSPHNRSHPWRNFFIPNKLNCSL